MSMTVRQTELFMEMHADIKTMLSDNVAIKKTLYGNGKPGLNDRMTVAETRQNDCQTSTRARSTRLAIQVSVAAIVCSCATSFILFYLSRPSTALACNNQPTQSIKP